MNRLNVAHAIACIFAMFGCAPEERTGFSVSPLCKVAADCDLDTRCGPAACIDGACWIVPDTSLEGKACGDGLTCQHGTCAPPSVDAGTDTKLGCVAGPACDPSPDPCYLATCEWDGSCSYSFPTWAGVPCKDGVCDGAGKCIPAGAACDVDTDCGDENPCTFDGCYQYSHTCYQRTDMADGHPCPEGTCHDGKCQP